MWPDLPYEAWIETRETLHRFTQIVGKIRLALTPLVNHWWNVPLYVSARGLTTSLIPYGDRSFDMELDFVDHVLHIRSADGAARDIALGPRSVADVHNDVFAALHSMDIECEISPMPSEIPNADVPLDEDRQHKSYDRDFVNRFWHALIDANNVFNEFRARFIGKSSPVHFYWGTFDLAVSRFSGRRAPPRPGADAITREAYSHEVSSVGFWPGDSRMPKSTFFAYAAPEPSGFRTSRVAPPQTYYNESLGGFYLDYDVIRRSDDGNAILLAFCQSTYEAAANAAGWNRAELERAL